MKNQKPMNSLKKGKVFNLRPCRTLTYDVSLRLRDQQEQARLTYFQLSLQRLQRTTQRRRFLSVLVRIRQQTFVLKI